VSSLDDLLGIAHEAIDLAHEIVITRSPGDIQEKGDRDFTSQVDFEVERTVREFLGKRTPAMGFIGEEEGVFGGGDGLEPTWALDPLDGTSNFIHGLPLCGISLGLICDQAPVLGVVDLPFLRERYSAARGRGAFLGKQEIAVPRNKESLRDAIVSIGDYAVGHKSPAKNRVRLALTRLLAGQVERIRMFGSAAIDLVWVAGGRTDVSIALSNKPWDMAAGVIIARESGAHVFDTDGSSYTTRSTATIVASGTLAPQVLHLVSQAIGEDQPET
jgi:myo-inositol-1(or 4)-monophosphatase